MTNKLTPTTFSVGATDSLAATDQYKIKSGKGINSIQEISHASGNILSNLIAAVTGNTPDILSSAAGKVTLSSDALMTRLFASNTAIKASFNQLSSVSQANVLAKVNSDSALNVQVNEIASVVNGMDIERISGFANITNKLAGSELITLSDKDATASLYAGLVKEANQLGISGSLPALLTGVTDNNLITSIIKSSVPDLVKFGDINSISGLLTNAIGLNLSDIYPNFATDIAGAFGLKFNKDGTLNLDQSYLALIQLMNVTHPGWNDFKREGGADNGYRLSKILTGSSDHIRTFQEGGKSRGTGEHKFHAMVGVLKARSVAEDTRRSFSNVIPSSAAILKSNTGGVVSRNSTIDPIVSASLQAIGLLSTVLFG